MGKQDYEEEEEDMQDHEKEDMQDHEEEEDKPLVVLLMDMPCYSMNNS